MGLEPIGFRDVRCGWSQLVSVFWGRFSGDLWVLLKPPYLLAIREVTPEVGLWPGTECLLPEGLPIPVSGLTHLSVCTYVVVVVHTFNLCLQTGKDCRTLCFYEDVLSAVLCLPACVSTPA